MIDAFLSYGKHMDFQLKADKQASFFTPSVGFLSGNQEYQHWYMTFYYNDAPFEIGQDIIISTHLIQSLKYNRIRKK